MKEFWEKNKANIALAVLLIYTLILGVAAADDIFKLGMFPTKLEKMIAKSIDEFSSPDAEAKQKAINSILEYGDFAAPQLMKAMREGGETEELSISCMQKITGQKFKTVEEWNKWYEANKHNI